MSTVVVPHPTGERRPLALRRVAIAGAVMAALDIAYAWANWVVVQHVITTEQLFHSIAAGLVGRDAARAGGMQTALLGAFLHVVIAFLWTIGFYLAVRSSATLRGWMGSTGGAVLVGLAYGAVVYLAMNYVVIPLSAAPRPNPTLDWKFYFNLVQHMLMVGLPIALIIRDGEPG
ncbi:MAG TPA: hypothetical protein VEX86_09700 [Longimicrobium sp.]|nr:hypothetical protein [Longimicrobium sp.]